MPQLTIRAEQMAVFRNQMEIDWLDERLSELYPDFAASSPNERKQWIEGGLTRAAAFQLSPNDHLPFLSLEQTFGAGCFDSPEYHWGRKILEDTSLEPSRRMRHLKKAAVRRLLDEEDRLAAPTAANQEADAQ
jgi:hypothetical protein